MAHHNRFTEWAKQYGGMYSLKLGTGTAVVLTDRRLVKQLVDKKSNIYSNRPPSFVSHDLITGGDHLLVMQYGNLWRSFRKMIHQYFMESMVLNQHIVVQNAEAVQMIRDYMISPEEHMQHPKRYSNSIIMSLRKSCLAIPLPRQPDYCFLSTTLVVAELQQAVLYCILTGLSWMPFLHWWLGGITETCTHRSAISPLSRPLRRPRWRCLRAFYPLRTSRLGL